MVSAFEEFRGLGDFGSLMTIARLGEATCVTIENTDKPAAKRRGVRQSSEVPKTSELLECDGAIS
jgi:hypothetical protein